MDRAASVHPSAFVDPPASIGPGTRIWHFSHVLSGTTIGSDCTIGQNVVIGPDVTIGDRCKVQNNVSVYKGVVLEDGVFCGPSCVFTNVLTPRAEVERKDEFLPTYVRTGATIGANATIVNTVTDTGGGATRVDAVTDFTITGRLARFGRGGMIEDISNRLLREFSECLQAKLAAEDTPAPEAAAAPSAAPVRGVSLFLSVLWERIRRLFRRG